MTMICLILLKSLLVDGGGTTDVGEAAAGETVVGDFGELDGIEVAGAAG